MDEIKIVKGRPHTREENEKFVQRAYADMIRMIAVDRLRMHPFTNHEVLPLEKKNRVIEEMNKIKETFSKQELRNEFDRICREKLQVGKIDYSRFKEIDGI